MFWEQKYQTWNTFVPGIYILPPHENPPTAFQHSQKWQLEYARVSGATQKERGKKKEFQNFFKFKEK